MNLIKFLAAYKYKEIIFYSRNIVNELKFIYIRWDLSNYAKYYLLIINGSTNLIENGHQLRNY